MNKKGFTLVELLATIVILGIVMGFALISVNTGFGDAKNKTEDVFIATIEDALDIYMDSDGKSKEFGITSVCTLNKTHGVVNVYRANITFLDVINSTYKPITQNDLVNPANKKNREKNYGICKEAGDISVSIYRDDDFVYYYKVDKSEFGCLNTDGVITNLPSGCLE